MRKIIYLDNASTTQVDPVVFDAMKPFLTDKYGNPGTTYSFGKESRNAIDEARVQVAEFIGADPSQIIFTGSGTEANNLAIKMLRNPYIPPRKKIIISAIEHDSVRNSAEYLKQKCGYEVVVLGVDRNGIINDEQLRRSIDDDTALLSVMFTNNEIGSFNYPICVRGHKHGALFHCDCVQAIGQHRVNVSDYDFDSISISAHKIHGPKGVGALYVRDKRLLEPIINGGNHQEFGLRGGTENVAGIVGFGKACEVYSSDDSDRVLSLKYNFIKKMKEYVLELGINDIFHVNAHSDVLSGKILSVRFDNVDAETLVLLLSTKGVFVSAGSACRSLEQEPSHVLTAIGLTPEMARNTIRISFSKFNSEEDMSAAKTIVDAAYSLYKLTR